MMKTRNHKHNYLVQLNVSKYKGTKYRGFNNYIVKAGVFENYE